MNVLDCGECAALFGDGESIRRTERARAAAEAHVSDCGACSAAYAPDIALWNALAAIPEAEAPPIPRARRRSNAPRILAAAAAALIAAVLLRPCDRLEAPSLEPAPKHAERVILRDAASPTAPEFSQSFSVARPSNTLASPLEVRRVARPIVIHAR